MKNYFNIKTLAIFVLTFICFFAFNNKVDARSICYYRDIRFVQSNNEKTRVIYENLNDLVDKSTGEKLNKDNILVQLIYDNGNVSFSYYNKSSKKTYSTLYSKELDMTFSISGESGKSLTDDDFAARCPNSLDQLISQNYLSGDYGMYIFDKIKEGSEYYQAFYGNYHGTYLEQLDGAGGSTGISGSTCYQKGHDENLACGKAMQVTISDTVIDQNSSGRSCSYIQYNAYGNGGNYQIKTELVLTMNSKTKTLSAERKVGDVKSPRIAFTYDDTNGQCPIMLYNDAHAETDGVLYMAISATPKDDIETYALIRSIKQGRDDIKDLDGCQIFGSAAKYIRIAYKFLRYAIPTLIVIFSVLDFLGVVFSGEDEKMEKAKSKFIKRIIVGILILLIPVILEFILKLAGINGGYQNLPDMVCTWLS